MYAKLIKAYKLYNMVVKKLELHQKILSALYDECSKESATKQNILQDLKISEISRSHISFKIYIL